MKKFSLSIPDDIKLDQSMFEFIQIYTGIGLDDARAFFSNNAELCTSGDSVSQPNDCNSGEISLASTSIMRTSTLKKCVKKTVPPKNEPKKMVCVKELHTKTEISKIFHKDSIKMYYQNVRSIKSDDKMESFNDTSVRNYDVVILTETWLDAGQPLKGQMNVLNEYYDVYRGDRPLGSKAGGGGALIAVSATLYSDRVPLNGFDHLEFVCVQFCNESKSIFVYCAYIPPMSTSTKHIYKDHFQAIRSINVNINDILIVVGDFNIPNIEWQSNDNKKLLPQPVTETRELTEKLAELAKLQSDRKLHQLSNYKNPKGNVLDLVFSNDADHTSVSLLPESELPLSKQDKCHPRPFEIVLNSNSLQ